MDIVPVIVVTTALGDAGNRYVFGTFTDGWFASKWMCAVYFQVQDIRNNHDSVKLSISLTLKDNVPRGTKVLSLQRMSVVFTGVLDLIEQHHERTSDE